MTKQDWHEKRYGKGEFVFKQGTWGDRVYEIQSGEVVIFRHGDNNQMVPIATIGPGELFGEMYLLNKEHVRNASAVATSELVVRIYFEEVVIQDMVALSPRQRKLVEGLTKKLVEITDVYVVQKSKEMASKNLAELNLEEGQRAANKFLPSVKPVNVDNDKLSYRD